MSISKKDKGVTALEFNAQVKEIRHQLTEQLRCLDQRSETQVAIITELNDYLKRRAEIDAEYAKQLDKLARSFMQKQKNDKVKRETWSLYSACTLFQQLVDDTKEEASYRSRVSDVLSNDITHSLLARGEDITRITRKCREIGTYAHSEINRVLCELHTAMKTYQVCFADSKAMNAKLIQAEHLKTRYEEANPTKTGTTRKHKALVKHVTKTMEKYDVVKLKCMRARNEYMLCVQAANAALNKYFADDLSDLIDCMDLGLGHWMGQLVEGITSCRKYLCQKEMGSLASLSAFRESLDAKADKQKFIEANHSTFVLPRRFEFKGEIGDQTRCLSAEKGIADELTQRSRQIEIRLVDLRNESDDIWRTLETAEKHIFHLQTADLERALTLEKNSENSAVSNFSTAGSAISHKDQKLSKYTLNDVVDQYVAKFSHYLLNGNLIHRLEARANGIRSALGAGSSCAMSLSSFDNSIGQCSQYDKDNGTLDSPVDPTLSHQVSIRTKKKRIGDAAVRSREIAHRRPRLFGGSLEEYVEKTGEQIPLVITSCIRVISQYALHHQGIFRVSGSQIEINTFKEIFERGDDALKDVMDASDVNSVAGVLKLYLRELREPIFPIYLFDQLIDCAKANSSSLFISKIMEIMNSLPHSSFLLLRYLFAFLNHLSEFSDENMMDPYNLAICFGPTLLPIPEGKDQVMYHNHVNDLVKYLIVYHESVFSLHIPGPIYEKYRIGNDDTHLFIDDSDGLTGGEEDNYGTHSETKKSSACSDFAADIQYFPITTDQSHHQLTLSDVSERVPNVWHRTGGSRASQYDDLLALERCNNAHGLDYRDAVSPTGAHSTVRSTDSSRSAASLAARFAQLNPITAEVNLELKKVLAGGARSNAHQSHIVRGIEHPPDLVSSIVSGDSGPVDIHCGNN
uniref:Rho-GAP domain-containing protein n=1 Tax=Steinernema glaseri TaxID=37863 RepID=A0A1I7YFH6_9BILA